MERNPEVVKQQWVAKVRVLYDRSEVTNSPRTFERQVNSLSSILTLVNSNPACARHLLLTRG
ncbi:MAG: hypothetical protein Tsb009_39100 [Planctomycetaceae bacterium]